MKFSSFKSIQILLTKLIPTEVKVIHDSFAKYWTSWRLNIGVALVYSVTNWLTISNWFMVDFDVSWNKAIMFIVLYVTYAENFQFL